MVSKKSAVTLIFHSVCPLTCTPCRLFCYIYTYLVFSINILFINFLDEFALVEPCLPILTTFLLDIVYGEEANPSMVESWKARGLPQSNSPADTQKLVNFLRYRQLVCLGVLVVIYYCRLHLSGGFCVCPLVVH